MNGTDAKLRGGVFASGTVVTGEKNGGQPLPVQGVYSLFCTRLDGVGEPDRTDEAPRVRDVHDRFRDRASRVRSEVTVYSNVVVSHVRKVPDVGMFAVDDRGSSLTRDCLKFVRRYEIGDLFLRRRHDGAGDDNVLNPVPGTRRFAAVHVLQPPLLEQRC